MANLNSIGGLHYEMMRRCYNPKCIAFKDYGAEGIKYVMNGMIEKFLKNGAKKMDMRKA